MIWNIDKPTQKTFKSDIAWNNSFFFAQALFILLKLKLKLKLKKKKINDGEIRHL